MLLWKEESNGKTALLVEGARRIGKSTIVEQFARQEYKSYILIDFNKASQKVKSLFDDLTDLGYLFLYLQTTYKTTLHPRESVMVEPIKQIHNGQKMTSIIMRLTSFCPEAQRSVLLKSNRQTTSRTAQWMNSAQSSPNA